MARYAVLIFENATDLPPEVLEAHGKLPERIAERGGRVVAGLALEPEDTATAIRGDLVTDGPFVETTRRAASRSRPRSRRCTRRRPPTRRPTGRRSARSTTRCSRAGRRPSSR
jgi:hypothetical protein